MSNQRAGKTHRAAASDSLTDMKLRNFFRTVASLMEDESDAQFYFEQIVDHINNGGSILTDDRSTVGKILGVQMHIEVLEEGVDVDALLQDLEYIKTQLNNSLSDNIQIGLQSVIENDDPLTAYNSSIGRGKDLKYHEKDYEYLLWDTPTINHYIQKYQLVRARVMVSKPKSCLTLHKDTSPRIHIPLFTTEDSVMIIEDRVYHLELGKVYLTNTTLRHTAVNASRQPRGHIVGCSYFFGASPLPLE